MNRVRIRMNERLEIAKASFKTFEAGPPDWYIRKRTVAELEGRVCDVWSAKVDVGDAMTGVCDDTYGC